MKKSSCCCTEWVLLFVGFSWGVGLLCGVLYPLVFAPPVFCLPAEIMPFFGGVVFILVCMCFFVGCTKGQKTALLDCAVTLGGFGISVTLIVLYIKSKATTDFTLGNVSGVIAAIGTLITVRWIYRQYQENKRQFSLTSFQNAFFMLYGSSELRNEKPLDARTPEDIPMTFGILELIRLNLSDKTLEPKNADYYLGLLFQRVEYSDSLVQIYAIFMNAREYKLHEVESFLIRMARMCQIDNEEIYCDLNSAREAFNSK